MPDEKLDVSIPGSTGDEGKDLANDLSFLGDETAALGETETEETPETDSGEGESEDGEEKLETKEDDEQEGDEEKTPKEKEEPEEDLELGRHSYGDIKQKYPNFFKDFPGLKTAFFREQEFSKLFPTIDDAKEAIEVKDRFDNIKSVVLTGDVNTFLQNLPDQSRARFAEAFLPDLFEVDKEAYYSVTTPVIQNILSNVFKSAAHKRDKNLGNAAILAYQEIFGGELNDIPNYLSQGAPQAKRQRVEDDPDRIAIQREREELYLEKRINVQNMAWSEVSRELTRDIEKGLDPNNAIRPGLKKIIVDKIFNEVISEVAKDSAHVRRMDDIWDRERKTGYRGAFKDSLKNTYLSRAKALVPKIRQRIRAEIAGSQKANDKNLANRVARTNERKDVQAGRQAKPASKITSAKDPEFRKMSDIDFLSR